eukprot:8773642-Pyramimonas_sp.AAC.2
MVQLVGRAVTWMPPRGRLSLAVHRAHNMRWAQQNSLSCRPESIVVILGCPLASFRVRVEVPTHDEHMILPTIRFFHEASEVPHKTAPGMERILVQSKARTRPRGLGHDDGLCAAR